MLSMRLKLQVFSYFFHLLWYCVLWQHKCLNLLLMMQNVLHTYCFERAFIVVQNIVQWKKIPNASIVTKRNAMERSLFIITYIKKIVQICIILCFFVMHNHKIVSCIRRDTNWERQEVCLWNVDGENIDRIHIGGWRLFIVTFIVQWPQRNIFINKIIEFSNLTMEHNNMFAGLWMHLIKRKRDFRLWLCFRSMFWHLYNLHINCYYYYERIIKMIY